MIVVSDTSPITSLLAIDKVDILRRIYGSVYIPSGVMAELRAHHAALPDFFQVLSPKDAQCIERLHRVVDRGEAEAIALAVELHADVLLIDDAKGRRTALREGLDVIGLLGVCVIAKRNSLITSLRETIDALETDAGFYVSADLRKEVLAAVGES